MKKEFFYEIINNYLQNKIVDIKLSVSSRFQGDKDFLLDCLVRYYSCNSEKRTFDHPVKNFFNEDNFPSLFNLPRYKTRFDLILDDFIEIHSTEPCAICKKPEQRLILVSRTKLMDSAEFPLKCLNCSHKQLATCDCKTCSAEKSKEDLEALNSLKTKFNKNLENQKNEIQCSLIDMMMICKYMRDFRLNQYQCSPELYRKIAFLTKFQLMIFEPFTIKDDFSDIGYFDLKNKRIHDYRLYQDRMKINLETLGNLVNTLSSNLNEDSVKTMLPSCYGWIIDRVTKLYLVKIANPFRNAQDLEMFDPKIKIGRNTIARFTLLLKDLSIINCINLLIHTINSSFVFAILHHYDLKSTSELIEKNLNECYEKYLANQFEIPQLFNQKQAEDYFGFNFYEDYELNEELLNIYNIFSNLILESRSPKQIQQKINQYILG